MQWIKLAFAVSLALSSVAVPEYVQAQSRSAQRQAQAGLSLQQIAQMRMVGQTRISPDGQHVAYVRVVPRTLGAQEDGVAWTELHVSDRDGQTRAYVTGQVNVGSVQFSADSRSVYYLARRQGDSRRALYRIDLEGGESKKIASLPSGIRNYSFSADGQQLAMLAMEEESEAVRTQRSQGFTQKVYEEDWRAVQLWLAQLDAEGKATAAVHVPVDGSVQSLTFSPAGDRIALTVAPRELTDDTLVFTRVRIIDRQGRVLGQAENPGKVGNLAWSRNGRYLAFISAEDKHDAQQGRLMVTSANGGAFTDVLPQLQGHVMDVAWRDDETVMFISHEGVEARLGQVSATGANEQTVLPLGGPIWTGFSVAENGAIALTGSTPQHPAEAFYLPAQSQTARKLTQSNPWLEQVRLAQQEVIRYQSRDGIEVEGLLIHPLQRRQNMRVPLITVVHGGPESHYSNGWLTHYSQPVQHAAAQGYAVFLPNYRSSTGRGVAYSKLGFGKPGMGEFDDVVDGVDHLIARGLVAADKVGITGGSYGGYASAWGATYYSERFAAAVMFVGISDQASLITTGDIPWEQYLVHMGQWPWENPELFRQQSPITHAARSNTPTLILHGEADPRVPVMQSYMFYRYLKLAGNAPVRLVVYPGEGHGNQRAASRYDYSLRLMQWMDHYLKGPGGEPPAYQLDYGLSE